VKEVSQVLDAKIYLLKAIFGDKANIYTIPDLPNKIIPPIAGRY
jgi:hypothetical protein